MNFSKLVSIVSIAGLINSDCSVAECWESDLAFVSALLKDIRLERARVTEKDKLRLLFVTKFFLEYFLTLRAQDQPFQSDKNNSKESENWPFGMIAEVIERDWIVWVLKRMREAVDEKVVILYFLVFPLTQVYAFLVAQTMDGATSRHRMSNSTLTPY